MDQIDYCYGNARVNLTKDEKEETFILQNDQFWSNANNWTKDTWGKEETFKMQQYDNLPSSFAITVEEIVLACQ